LLDSWDIQFLDVAEVLNSLQDIEQVRSI
jgi:hypothetical protein